MPTPRKSAAPTPAYDPTNPFIVQSDRSILVEVDNPKYAAARDALAPFAELEKSPEHIHTYRITDLSLWNAAAAGMTAEQMLDVLAHYSKFPLPTNLAADVEERVSRYGRVKLERDGDHLRLVCADGPLLEELARQPKVRPLLGERLDAVSFRIDPGFRGVLKQALITVGYPAEDLAGYTEGAPLPVHLRQLARSGLPFQVRDYQREASEVFYAGGDARGGSGVIVLPCGAGKTIVGIAAEVHLLPAPVFRVTAQIQARRRLGLTATLVREDGREGDVFSLIGPKKYDVPWRELETRGWIAEATCTEIRIGLPEAVRMEYAVAEWRNKYRIASENPAKDDVVAALLDRYRASRVLVIGQYLRP